MLILSSPTPWEREEELSPIEPRQGKEEYWYYENDAEAGSVYEENEEDDSQDSFMKNPFKPFDNLPEERSRVLTVRALVIGISCGALVNASNIYLGLKTGWSFSANLFGVS